MPDPTHAGRRGAHRARQRLTDLGVALRLAALFTITAAASATLIYTLGALGWIK